MALKWRRTASRASIFYQKMQNLQILRQSQANSFPRRAARLGSQQYLLKKGTKMITLYGVYRSRATRPIWILTELNLAFTHIPVIQSYRLAEPKADGAALNTATPAFLAINPSGQIPVYEEDGLILTESLAITLHIARAYGGLLGPQSLAEAAQMEQWSLFAATSVETPALEMMYVQADGGDKTPEGQASIAVNAEKLRRPLTRLEAHLSAHEWLVGARFTAADINTAEVLRYAQGHPTLLAEFPATKTWLERCQARPAFQAMWAARLAEPA
jgi:glutathione S-transferase